MLLVDADQAEVRHRREDGRAGADDDRRLAGDDPLALVAPLGVGQARVQHGDAVAEARLEAAERLRRQRDLRHEHDRAAAARERGRAGLEVDLRLAAAGRAGEEQVAAAAVDRRDDPRDRPPPAAPSARAAPPRRPCRRPSAVARRAGRAASARRARAPAPASSRSSRRARARDRRAPAAARRATPSIGAVSTPAGASTPVSTTTPRAAARPKRIETTAPLPTPSGTS